MISCDITLNIEETPWPDVLGKSMWDIFRIGRLPQGTTSGKSTVTILMRERNTGTVVMGETTMAVFTAAAGALEHADNQFKVGVPPHALVAKLSDLLARITNVVSSLDSDKVPYENPEQQEYTHALLKEAEVALNEAAGL